MTPITDAHGPLPYPLPSTTPIGMRSGRWVQPEHRKRRGEICGPTQHNESRTAKPLHCNAGLAAWLQRMLHARAHHPPGTRRITQIITLLSSHRNARPRGTGVYEPSLHPTGFGLRRTTSIPNNRGPGENQLPQTLRVSGYEVPPRVLVHTRKLAPT
jgi:hypothetical protein